jgi:carbon monoxide dehydrogenase subunit G
VELVNEFRGPVSMDQAWEVLTDVERIAPCIPGAQLLTVDGDDFTGAAPVAKRVLPVAGRLAVGVAIGFRLGRRRS